MNKSSESVSYKRSLLIGMLLGHADSTMSVVAQKRQAQFTVEQPVEQRDLANWKATEIQRVFAVKVRYTQQQIFSFTAGRRVRIIHQWFHRGERKTITPKIRFLDHPIGLTLLLCDAGYLNAQHLNIKVYPFVETEINLLLAHIKTLFGADGYIKFTGTLPEICFDTNNSRIIWQRTRNWLPKVSSVQRKFQSLIQADGNKEGRHPNESSRG
jgi:hypothetical protein